MGKYSQQKCTYVLRKVLKQFKNKNENVRLKGKFCFEMTSLLSERTLQRRTVKSREINYYDVLNFIKQNKTKFLTF